VISTEFNAEKYFVSPRLRESDFLHDMALSSTRLSFYSCNYGIINGWCPYNMGTKIIHQCRKCYNSCLKEIPLPPPKNSSVSTTSTGITKCLFTYGNIRAFDDLWTTTELSSALCLENNKQRISLSRQETFLGILLPRFRAWRFVYC
jgi:hypothetical protein